MPGLFTVNQTGYKREINKIKEKIFLKKKIRKISSFSLDRGYKEQRKSILREGDLESH